VLHCCFVTLEYCYTVPLLSAGIILMPSYTGALIHCYSVKLLFFCTVTLKDFTVLLCYPGTLVHSCTVELKYSDTLKGSLVTLLLKYIGTLLLPCYNDTLHYFTVTQLNLLTVSQLRCYFVTLTNDDENARPNSNSENILLLAFLVAKIPAKCCSAVLQLSVQKRNQMLFLGSTFNYPKR
jgi:hypothetical protein